MKNRKFKLLASALLLGLSTLTLASCKNPIDVIKGWFDDDPVTTETPTTSQNVTVDGTDVEQGTSVPLPKQAIFKKASARTALTVSATITPDNATQKIVLWSLSWKETSTEAISDYVTITPSTDTLSCSITVKKGFNIPIILTAETKDGISATCQLDFLKQVTTVDMEYGGAYNSDYFWTSQTFDFEFGNNIINYSGFNENADFQKHFQMWNCCDETINDYYRSIYPEINPIYLNSSSVVGTVGDFHSCANRDENIKIDEEFARDGSAFYNIYLTSAALTAVRNAGYGSYIKDGDPYYQTDDSMDANFFERLFYTTNMTSEVANNILKVLNDLENDVVEFVIEWHTYLDIDHSIYQNIRIKFKPVICDYVASTGIDLNNSTIVAS